MKHIESNSRELEQTFAKSNQLQLLDADGLYLVQFLELQKQIQQISAFNLCYGIW